MTQSPSQVQVLLSYVAQMLSRVTDELQHHQGGPPRIRCGRQRASSIGLDPVDDEVVCILKHQARATPTN